ncbi:MAG TPA: DUF6069 family protein [Roseiflexaceae bacterium]|nr:DUF6069 family protein [Roseiflexaceae bacterium]
MAGVSSTQPTQRVAFSRLLWAGPLAIIAAAIANVLIQQIAVAVLRPNPQFLPLTPGATIFFTVVGVLGAVIVYGLVGRFSRRPVWLFKRIALVALIISFIPDIVMLITGFNPGTTAANVAVLIVMHIVAWAIAVGILTRLASTEG